MGYVVPEALLPSMAVTPTMLLEATAIVVGFIALLFLGSIFLPGKELTGPDLEGEQRVYKMNGLALFVLTLLIVGVGQGFGWFSLSVLHSHFLALFIVINVLAFAYSGYLVFRGNRQARQDLSLIRGYFYGVDAGPVLFGVDTKFFSYRPSLIGLALFNVSFAVVQFETTGELTL